MVHMYTNIAIMASCEQLSFLISKRLLKPAKNNRPHAMTVRLLSEGQYYL